MKLPDMKETVLDVLMYLFNNYLEDEYEVDSDQESLRSELVQAGFSENQVTRAFEWLEGLSENKELIHCDSADPGKAIRLFTEHEMERMDASCRGFLLFLEQIGILNTRDRELVIDRVMVLDTEDLDLQQLKWIIVMVLLNQPENGRDMHWMEDIVMDEMQTGIH